MSTGLNDTERPYLSAYVLCVKGGKIALVLRENTGWMNGYWGLLSGKVEIGEEVTSAAIREALEEGGLSIKRSDLRHAVTVHRYAEDTGSWLDVYFIAEHWDGELVNADPADHSQAAWFDLDSLPKNMIPAHKAGIEAWRSGKSFVPFGWQEEFFRQ